MASINGVSEYQEFLKLHAAQLQQTCVPEKFWKTIFHKLKLQVFDAGDTFLIAQFEDGNRTVVVNRENGCIADDSQNIFLVDHAWTFENKDAMLQLAAMPQLLERMAALIGISENLSLIDKINDVYLNMWKYARTYSRKIDADEPPVVFWYIMDEFGSTIKHSSEPNFRAVPFFCQTDEIVYTLLFPICDVEENEEINIDFVEGANSDDRRARNALLVPWTGESFFDVADEQLEPGEEYFLSGAHTDHLPNRILPTPQMPSVLKVYSEYSVVRDNLYDPNFELVDNEEEADILWLNRHFYDFKELNESRPGTFINQFPCERVITTKDLLSIIARRSKDCAKWYPKTFNMITELPEFVGFFQRREIVGLDNHWICKPWNLARALDTTVSNNLNLILRLPFSGPKIAQKYVENPVLFRRPDIGLVKFDVRYVVLLKSVEPLKIYCYKKFFLRFANKPFELTDLWDYDKHFTVMNYRDESALHHVECEDFKAEYAAQYPEQCWADIEKDILSALKSAFVAACQQPPPKGLGNFPQSRALYAADLVLAWDAEQIKPLLLEINFGPDCERACLYYPDFYDDIFLLLFKNQLNAEKFHIL